MSRTALITGGAGGLGAATSRLLASRGFSVLAADLEGEALEALRGEPGITPISLDVTDPASVEAVREEASRLAPEGLDGLVGFAGVLAVGPFIEIDEETIRRVVEVNVLGTIRVNRVLFPLVLRKKGRIVTVSSETGWQAVMPFNGPYAMTKRAIECYSDALRRELALLGVPVIKVQPGPFRTAMLASIERAFDEAEERSTYFSEILGRLKGVAVAEGGRGRDPVLVARAVHRALTAARPLPAYSVKPDLGRSVASLLPAPLLDAILRRALR